MLLEYDDKDNIKWPTPPLRWQKIDDLEEIKKLWEKFADKSNFDLDSFRWLEACITRIW